MGKTPDAEQSSSEEETARRANAALRVALNTPHKRHSESKIGKPGGKPKASPRRRESVKKFARSYTPQGE